MRVLKEETTFTAAKLFTPSLTHFFSVVGSTLCSFFRTNKGLSPHHSVAMLGKRDWSLTFFFKGFLPWLYGELLLANLFLHTSKSAASVIDMSFGISSQAHWGLCANLFDILSQQSSLLSLRIGIRPVCMCVCVIQVHVSLSAGLCCIVYCLCVYLSDTCFPYDGHCRHLCISKSSALTRVFM